MVVGVGVEVFQQCTLRWEVEVGAMWCEGAQNHTSASTTHHLDAVLLKYCAHSDHRVRPYAWMLLCEELVLDAEPPLHAELVGVLARPAASQGGRGIQTDAGRSKRLRHPCATYRHQMGLPSLIELPRVGGALAT